MTETAEFSFEPDLDVVGHDFVVAWYEQSRTGHQKAKVGLWTQGGEAKWVQTLSASDRNGRNPVVRTVNGKFFCVWLEQSTDSTDVWARWLDRDGSPLSPPRRIAPAGPTTWNLNVLADREGHAWVVFDATADTLTDEVFLVRVHDTLSTIVQLTADDGFSSKYPDLVIGSGQAALTWFDERDGNREVYMLVAPLEQLTTGGKSLIMRVTTTPGESIGAYLALNEHRLGLAWSDDSEGNHEVYFQSFDLEGTATLPPLQLTENPTASLIPSIRSWNEGFALAWNEDLVHARDTHGLSGRSKIVFTLVP